MSKCDVLLNIGEDSGASTIWMNAVVRHDFLFMRNCAKVTLK